MAVWLISLALAGYGDAIGGLPTHAEREMHLWSNLVRVDPLAFQDDYPCSFSSFTSTEQTPHNLSVALPSGGVQRRGTVLRGLVDCGTSAEQQRRGLCVAKASSLPPQPPLLVARVQDAPPRLVVSAGAARGRAALHAPIRIRMRSFASTVPRLMCALKASAIVSSSQSTNAWARLEKCCGPNR